MRLLTAGARLGLGVRASAQKLLGKPAVQALMTYLKSAKARAVIHSYGYDLP